MSKTVIEIWSTDQILESYFPYWKDKMLGVNKADLISEDRCIKDWCTVHWAVESSQFGKNLK